MHDEHDHEGTFAEGEEEKPHTDEAEHKGSFAEGQEDEEHHQH